MTRQPVRFYQVGSFAVGNRLLTGARIGRVQSDPQRSNSLDSGHRACQGCGEALGARYALDAAMRATGGQLVAVNATGLPRGLLHAVPRDLVADRLAPLALRQRAGGGDRRRGGAEGEGPGRHQRRRAGGRRRHRRHRLRLPVGDVRAQRRRAVRLLRQRGLHEHRRAALRRDAAGGAHGDDRGGRARSGQRLRAGQEPARLAMAHGIPYVATATVADLHDLEDKVEPGHELHGARYLHILVPCPLGLGLRVERHDQGRAARRPRPGSSRSSRPSTAR